jgi:hypothetical protein
VVRVAVVMGWCPLVDSAIIATAPAASLPLLCNFTDRLGRLPVVILLEGIPHP